LKNLRAGAELFRFTFV